MATRNEYSAENILKEVSVDSAKWNVMAFDREVKETADAISKRGIKVIIIDSSEEALAMLKEMIPAGAEVMNGSSTTLREIGYDDYLNGGTHGWKNMHETVKNEPDAAKRNDLRRKTVTAEYFLSSVNAIAKTGELVGCDASGSRVGAWPCAAKNIVLVAGTNKIVDTLDDAMKRVKEYVYPMENVRAKKVYGGTGTTMGKMAIIMNEIVPGRTTLILVKENLGY
jgi:L-lactate utilization protein LutB